MFSNGYLALLLFAAPLVARPSDTYSTNGASL